MTRPALLIILVGLLLAGCKTPPPNGSLDRVQPTSAQPRVGNVYLVRGWIGIFSEGIDTIGQRITEAGVRATVYQETQWTALAETIEKRYAAAPVREPIVLVGHSYGADAVLRIAKRLEGRNIPVDLVVTLDPVTPPLVPANITRTVNLYQSNGVLDALPWLRGIPLTAENTQASDRLTNVNLRDRPDLVVGSLDHFNIEKQPKVHQEVVNEVLRVCGPRRSWDGGLVMSNPAHAPASIDP